MTDAQTVLVVDDDADLAFLVSELLRRNGFDTITESTGRAALKAMFDHRPHLVVLDLGLPDLDGLEVLVRIRDLTDVPVLLLTARDRETDKVEGLSRGADDYLTKPFGNAELVARVHALLRRSPLRATLDDRRFDDGLLSVDFQAHTVSVEGRPVELTPTDWRLLSALVRHEGRVLSHDDLLELAWSDPQGVGPSKVKYAVLRLRQRLGWTDVETSPIQAVRGFGYRYASPTQR